MKKAKLRELGKIASHNVRLVEKVEKPVEKTKKSKKKEA